MTRKEKFLEEISLAVHGVETGTIGIPNLTVFIEMPDLPYHEQIFNPYENMSYKHAYYKAAYDDDLRLKANPKIRISKWVIK